MGVAILMGCRSGAKAGQCKRLDNRCFHHHHFVVFAELGDCFRAVYAIK
jgi:hypothetical protein